MDRDGTKQFPMIELFTTELERPFSIINMN